MQKLSSANQESLHMAIFICILSKLHIRGDKKYRYTEFW